ncbi:hypothetical protein PYW08_009832 [Mythimna loreyi]|uniref:Uncharacterized protein n=1 Tax=Mythimna loreyi TaxID=667449 RepID=A0ACC2Q8W2_9NEOP|nr:hypothetical protein PYW08_009832 [Mythimna loreyi]
MELHHPMTYLQADLPVFSFKQRRLKRNQNNPMRPALKSEMNPFANKLNKRTLEVVSNKNTEQPLKKMKVDLKEFKPNSGACLMSNSATVKPDAICLGVSSHLPSNVTKLTIIRTPPKGLLNSFNNEQKFIKPIKTEFLMQTETQNAEINRKRDGAAALNKTSEVENSQEQPIRSDPKIMKDGEMNQPVKTARQPVNFRLRKIEDLLKPSVLRKMKQDKTDEIKRQLDKDITALLRRIRTEVENEILHKSSISSIQNAKIKKDIETLDRPTSPQEQNTSRTTKTLMVAEYEPKAESGKDKINLNLDEQKSQPGVFHIGVQTDPVAEFPNLAMLRSVAEDQS